MVKDTSVITAVCVGLPNFTNIPIVLNANRPEQEQQTVGEVRIRASASINQINQ